MFDTVAHVGVEHPDLLWIAVPTLLAFAVGFALAVVAVGRIDEGKSTADPAGSPE